MRAETIFKRKKSFMTLIELNPLMIPEPDWRRLLSRKADREAASEHWRMLTRDMQSRNILSPVNAHAIMRLVLATIMHDRAAAKAMRSGPVTEPKAGNPRAIARPSLYFAAMREAGAMAAQLEADLGLSPRTRDKVAIVATRTRAPTGADRYLRARVSHLPPPSDRLPEPLEAYPTAKPENE
jgi:hypothetical protein